MKHSENMDKIAGAIAAVQMALRPALKDSSNPFFKSNYADLSSVWDACRRPLGANGLSVVQGLGRDEKDGYLWTTLLHTSGQYITGECPLILGKRDPQGVGSAMTYYRRYGLAAILGVTQEDDDGQGATKATTQPTQAPIAPAKADVKPVPNKEEVLKHTKALQDCKTSEALKSAWDKIPAPMQPALASVKDDVKKFLSEVK